MLIDFELPNLSTFGVKLPLDPQIGEKYSTWLPENMKRAALVRKQEYLAGRHCVVEAAKNAGFMLSELNNASTREPVWPVGVKGSITHSRSIVIGCVTKADEYLSVGIDAEEVISLKTIDEIETVVATPEEMKLIKKFNYQEGMTILFSAKEALYKALFPLSKCFIDFNEVKLVELNLELHEFVVELISKNEKLKDFKGTYRGIFKTFDNTVVSLILIPRDGKI